jgi:hypothetical protein
MPFCGRCEDIGPLFLFLPCHPLHLYQALVIDEFFTFPFDDINTFFSEIRSTNEGQTAHPSEALSTLCVPRTNASRENDMCSGCWLM